MKKLFYLLVIIGIVFVFFGYRFYSDGIHYSLNPKGNGRVIVDIQQGDTAEKVGQKLIEKGLIKSTGVFKFYLKQKNFSGQIKAGRIVLKENMTLPEIAYALIEGKSAETSVTLLEGWTIKQIGDYLEAEGLTTALEFMDCIEKCEFDGTFLPDDYLEGYLYPDTYFVNTSTFSNQQFIQRLISEFEKKIKGNEGIHLERSDISLDQIIIMASIIEREERNSNERATISGILWNRYNAKIGLGADATVLYALGRTKGGLTYKDLAIDSAYNTRKYRGLPPTPICNPSISSIIAAYTPTKTNYWYYLHDNEGHVHYAKTLEEHNENKRRYISN